MVLIRTEAWFSRKLFFKNHLSAPLTVYSADRLTAINLVGLGKMKMKAFNLGKYL